MHGYGCCFGCGWGCGCACGCASGCACGLPHKKIFLITSKKDFLINVWGYDLNNHRRRDRNIPPACVLKHVFQLGLPAWTSTLTKSTNLYSKLFTEEGLHRPGVANCIHAPAQTPIRKCSEIGSKIVWMAEQKVGFIFSAEGTTRQYRSNGTHSLHRRCCLSIVFFIS